jgi:hypothetical protein
MIWARSCGIVVSYRIQTDYGKAGQSGRFFDGSDVESVNGHVTQAPFAALTGAVGAGLMGAKRT